MYTLYIGDKNYSSWSLRPWLLLTVLGIEFEAKSVQVAGTGPNERHRPYSDNGLVPCLHDDDLQIWETLAIIETLHEQHDGVWPQDRGARAHARSVSNEMHAGFNALRGAMPMNIKLKLRGRDADPHVATDIARIATIWETARAKYGAHGPFLFGEFSAADAMFAPIVWRFETYNVSLSDNASQYQRTMLALPAMRAWECDALAEGVVMAYDELANDFGGPR